ncbi:MAG: hypothetical protein H0X34_08025 [Chthoniobacterales bacterium]|nr:hypothetical protein [Chthoniobacterales bacterium]
MTDHFALFGEARRPWLDPERLKEKHFARSRAEPPGAELNEAFRVLSDPKLRLHHLLILEGADLAAGRPVPAAVADLFWNTGTILRETESWLHKNGNATSKLAHAILLPARTRLEEKLEKLEEELRANYETEIARLRQIDSDWKSTGPNELGKLIELSDSISYLTRLLERTKEGRFRLSVA